MNSSLRFLTSTLLAVLVAAWTALCGAGVVSISRCTGGHASCGGMVHSHFALLEGGSEVSSALTEHSPAGRERDDGDHDHSPRVPCPHDHQHSSLEMPMTQPAPLILAAPVWFEFLTCPLPAPADPIQELALECFLFPGTGPPPAAAPPPFLACGPLLI